jgi:exopolysaccharide biosynthesis polyprenyl glycosylphosphotransferase
MNIKSQIAEVDQDTGGPSEQPIPVPRMALPFSERRVLLLFGDALVVNGAVLAAFYLWSRVGSMALDFGFVQQRGVYWFPLLTILWWILAHLADLYNIPVASRRTQAVSRLGIVGASLLIIYLVVYFFLPRDLLPRWFFLFFIGMAVAGNLLWRWLYTVVFALSPFHYRVIIAGAGQAGHTIAQVLGEEGEPGYHAVGFVDDDPEKQATDVAGLPVLGNSHDLLNLVRELQVSNVILAATHPVRGELFQALMDCRAIGVEVTRMPALYEQLTLRMPVEHIEQGWVLESMNGISTLSRPGQWVKRLSDIVLGILGGLIFLLLFPFLSLAIVIDSPGPVLYRQVRSGRGGKPFEVLKLRTMVPSAEKAGKPQWARRDDDRITHVGHLLRKVRLDEFPQVLNVLRGEMSIVGPRPERPEFIEELQEQIPFYRTRLCIRPGLTGWAQIHYGYGSSVEDALIKLQYDLYYIRHWSLWLDLYTIVKTVGVVLRFGGT